MITKGNRSNAGVKSEKRRIRRRRQISCAHFNLKAERGGVIGQKREKEKEKSALGKEGVGSSVLHRTRWTPAVLKRMISGGHATLLIFGLVLLATSGSALRCWVCSSNVNVVCNDPMNTTDHHAIFYVSTCDPGHYGGLKPICRKIVKREHGDRVVIRQCSVPYHDEIDIVDGPCGSSMTQQEHDESCHICSTDLCNSATTASTMQLLYAGALALLVFYQFKYCVL
ncbi:hypothetical protein HN011_004411 [Eciton burchellii]|nr:hypothetical protein HN011_004411 [Eciton burchellii]